LSPIFRKEATKKSSSLNGEVLLSHPLGYTISLVIALFIVVLIIIFLIFSTYSKKETVHGFIKPLISTINTYPSQAGIIDTIYFPDGQIVKKGDKLITINTEIGNGRELNESITLDINNRITSLENEMNSQNAHIVRELEQLTNSKLLLDKQVSKLQEQIPFIRERMKIKSNQVEGYKQITKEGQLSTREYEGIKEILLQLKQEEVQIQLTVLNKKQSSDSVNLQIMKARSNTDQLISNIEQKIIDKKLQLRQIHTQAQYNITAQRDGIISNLFINEGEYVTSKNLLLSIIPENTKYIAKLMLPSSSLSFVKLKQKVIIRYRAFSYQKYGHQEGQIINIGKSIVMPNEVNTPLNMDEPFYMVTVEMQQQTVLAMGKQHSIYEGMLLDADIIVHEMSLLEWIFEPILNLTEKI
jgi:membrane fusion protein